MRRKLRLPIQFWQIGMEFNFSFFMRLFPLFPFMKADFTNLILWKKRNILSYLVQNLYVNVLILVYADLKFGSW